MIRNSKRYAFKAYLFFQKIYWLFLLKSYENIKKKASFYDI